MHTEAKAPYCIIRFLFGPARLYSFQLMCVCVAGCIRMVKGEGMPQYRNPFEKGDLYVKFDVQFPENNWISAEKLNVSRDH